MLNVANFYRNGSLLWTCKQTADLASIVTAIMHP